MSAADQELRTLAEAYCNISGERDDLTRQIEMLVAKRDRTDKDLSTIFTALTKTVGYHRVYRTVVMGEKVVLITYVGPDHYAVTVLKAE